MLAAAATPASSPAQVFSVQCPGGSAPHFRVQVLSTDAQPRWKLFNSFGDLQRARQCVDRLRLQGFSVRMVAYSTAPTAA